MKVVTLVLLYLLTLIPYFTTTSAKGVLSYEYNIYYDYEYLNSPAPTDKPTRRPTKKPTKRPTKRPTRKPTNKPTKKPTRKPTLKPVKKTRYPSRNPSYMPTICQRCLNTAVPTRNPAF